MCNAKYLTPYVSRDNYVLEIEHVEKQVWLVVVMAHSLNTPREISTINDIKYDVNIDKSEQFIMKTT